jgi:uncharacterized membrane protein
MPLLLLAAVIWVFLHLGLAGTRLRDVVAERLGDRGFRALFSVLSIAAIIFLVRSYNTAAGTPLWSAPAWLRWLLVLVMLVASVLFVGSVATPNPTMVGGERVDAVRGMTRLTRHPMLWSFALWAAVHILGTGDSASLVFFGAFLVTSLAGMPSIDAKTARRDPARWRQIAATTSIVPGAAIASGRNHLAFNDIGWVVPLGGLALWLIMLFAHRGVIGVSPFG